MKPTTSTNTPAATAPALTLMTPRQVELLNHLVHGRRNPEIALLMGISRSGVKRLLERLFVRSGTADRVALAIWFFRVSGDGHMATLRPGRKQTKVTI